MVPGIHRNRRVDSELNEPFQEAGSATRPDHVVDRDIDRDIHRDIDRDTRRGIDRDRPHGSNET
jgi:hypothetical protein